MDKDHVHLFFYIPIHISHSAKNMLQIESYILICLSDTVDYKSTF
jgi:hypothetical protein